MDYLQSAIFAFALMLTYCDVAWCDNRFCESDEFGEDKETLLGFYPCYSSKDKNTLSAKREDVSGADQKANSIKTNTKTSVCEVEIGLPLCSSNLLTSKTVLPFINYEKPSYLSSWALNHQQLPSTSTSRPLPSYGVENFEIIDDTMAQDGYHLHRPTAIKNFYTIDERWFRLMIRKGCQQKLYRNLCKNANRKAFHKV